MAQSFTTLDVQLHQTQALWRFEPFHQSLSPVLPWLDSHPELCECLSALTDDDILDLKEDTPRLIQLLSPFIPQLSQLTRLCELPSNLPEELALPQGFEVGIPGRKWQQICAMGQAALTNNNSSEWLEWCAGKGYLGQILAQQSQLPVISFEWQQSLCDAGQMIAQQRHLPMSFIQGDALSQGAKQVLKPNQHAVALHACGDLHAHLIEMAAEVGLSALTISPCCYHLTRSDGYKALSNLGQQALLQLTKQELKIPLQETVTGGQRVQLHRRQEMTYRLAVDSLLREGRCEKHYTRLPSIKKSQLSLGFEHFCHWANQYKPLNLLVDNDEQSNMSKWLYRAEQRFMLMERMSLVQQVFRRALEMWLVYDKALKLEEQGYQVSLSTFCPRLVTPRNILIQAQRVNTESYTSSFL
ncbi:MULTISPECIES: methyltransferase [Vibrio]|uniref:methyltransferase n=1 Tax=Vibrio TaxID=662 RepID=UPI00389AE2AC